MKCPTLNTLFKELMRKNTHMLLLLAHLEMMIGDRTHSSDGIQEQSRVFSQVVLIS